MRDKGYSRQEAEAEVTGRSLESIRKRDFMEQARLDGHTGDSFDAVLTQYHLSLVGDLETQAEDATNGHMLKAGQQGRIHPGWFWFTSSDDVVREHASEELLAWFDEHGRLTRSELRRQILSGARSMQVQQQDFLQ